MKKTTLACTALALGLLSGSALANAITATAVVGNLYQQTVQSPCIFENPSCQQGTFVGTALPNGGNETDYDELSPVYQGSTLLAIIGAGNELKLGLDINQASGQPAQILVGFSMLINGVVVDSLNPAPVSVPAGNNGNGYADYLLAGFSTFGATDTVQFRFVFGSANDGVENVFLIGVPGNITEVPEPATLALIGLGLAGLGLSRRRKA